MFQLALSGRLTTGMVTRYIANVTYMVGLTLAHLRRAEGVARSRDDAALAAHFAHKFEEETGHAVWGEADLERLAAMIGTPPDTTVTRSIKAQAEYLVATIDEDPALYLAYMAFAEYITVLLGPELLSLIEERCGVPRTAMTVIGNHIDLDVEHVEEGFGVIDDLVGDPRRLAPMRRALAQMMAHFDGFCAEIASTTERAPASGTRLVDDASVTDLVNGTNGSQISAA